MVESPEVSYALLFPGQGSQHVGMGADLFAAEADLLGPWVDEILGFSLRETCLEHPEEVLTRTDRAQPALYALSYALWDLLHDRVGQPAAAAGHSLGEYTAHAAAGTFDFETGLRLVAARGRAMAEAAAGSDTGMVAIIGIEVEAARQAVEDRKGLGGGLSVANLNAPGQIVMSGAVSDLEWIEENMSEYGGRRAVHLNVSGAFHSPFMEPAREVLDAALEDAVFDEPAFPVYTNLTALPSTEPRGELSQQMVEPVRFSETIENMAAAGIDTYVHVGPGSVTTGLAKRAFADAHTHVVSSLDNLETVVSEMALAID